MSDHIDKMPIAVSCAQGDAINVLFYSTKICSLQLHETKKATNTYKCETLIMEFLAVLL